MRVSRAVIMSKPTNKKKALIQLADSGPRTRPDVRRGGDRISRWKKSALGSKSDELSGPRTRPVARCRDDRFWLWKKSASRSKS